LTAITELQLVSAFVVEKKDVPRVNHVPLDPVVVPDTLNGRVAGFTRLQIETDDIAISRLVLRRG
jgi:hypothetical protein